MATRGEHIEMKLLVIPNLINLIDFRDQLNVALKTDYKYFLTINLKKIFGRYLPHEGGL